VSSKVLLAKKTQDDPEHLTRASDKRLPADLRARLLELAVVSPVLSVACAKCHCYAVEDDQDHLRLDTRVCSDTGKTLPHAVLEFKRTRSNMPPNALIG
jgi:hypothetical protein